MTRSKPRNFVDLLLGRTVPKLALAAVLAIGFAVPSHAQRPPGSANGRAITEQYQRETPEREAEARRTFEQQRQAVEEKIKRQQEAERSAQQQRAQEVQAMIEREKTERAALAVEARKPVNRLRQAYFDYIYVRVCYGIRQGYLAVWINDVQLERARKAVAKIETIITAEDTSLDTAALWSHAESMKPKLYYAEECDEHFRNLMLALPPSPEAKDFGRSN